MPCDASDLRRVLKLVQARRSSTSPKRTSPCSMRRDASRSCRACAVSTTSLRRQPVVQPARGESGSPIVSPTAMVKAITSCFTFGFQFVDAELYHARIDTRLLSNFRGCPRPAPLPFRPAFPSPPVPPPASGGICLPRFQTRPISSRVYRAINPNSLCAHATEKQARRFSEQSGRKIPSLMIPEILSSGAGFSLREVSPA